MTKAQKEENRKEAIAFLQERIKPGDTLYTTVRHVARSGMSRTISIFRMDVVDGVAVPYDISGWVAHATGLTRDHKLGGVKVGGCGMDMGFHIVYELSSVLFRDGFTCIGRRRCPSNDHSNGDRNYRRHKHSDGGYALRQSWL